MSEKSISINPALWLVRMQGVPLESQGALMLLICTCQFQGGPIAGAETSLKRSLGVSNVRTVHRALGPLLEAGLITKLEGDRILAEPPRFPAG